MNIVRAASAKSKQGPAGYFTGTVWLEDLSAAGAAESAVRIARVSFEPGARTAWHTHPHGQTLHILSGIGRVQQAGGAVIDVHPGDVVWFSPGERHWHGAGPETAMVHLAVQLADAGGNAATWLEHVTDAEYRAG